MRDKQTRARRACGAKQLLEQPIIRQGRHRQWHVVPAREQRLPVCDRHVWPGTLDDEIDLHAVELIERRHDVLSLGGSNPLRPAVVHEADFQPRNGTIDQPSVERAADESEANDPTRARRGAIPTPYAKAADGEARYHVYV